MSPKSFAINHHGTGTADQLARLEHARRFDQDANWLADLEALRASIGGGGDGFSRPAAPCLPLKTEHASRFRQPYVSEKPLDPPSLSIALGGSLLSLKIPARPDHLARGDREKITAFSFAAHRNMMRKINAIDRRAISAERVALCTLTYPFFFVTPKAAKAHLKAWLRKMASEFGRVPLVWKLEPQDRGAPHFHLMIFAESVDQLQKLQAWAPLAWHKIAGNGDRRHLRFHLGQCGNGNEHCFQPIRSWNGVVAYSAKYLGKVFQGLRCEAWEHPGRYWGTRFYEDLPVRIRKRDLTSAKVRLARRLMRRWYEKQPTGRYRIFDPATGKVDRLWLRPHALKVYQDLGCQVRPYHRKWKNARGGMTIYSPDVFGRQLLAWLGEAFEVHDDEEDSILVRSPGTVADVQRQDADPAPF